MKPIRRKINRHFGLTAKKVGVRAHRPWYFQWLFAVVFMVIGSAFAYLVLHDTDRELVEAKLIATESENESLQTQLIEAQRDLQVELSANKNLAKELASVQDENLKIKEDLVFYKNMLNKRKRK